jgi:hypothetical protein
MSQTSLRLRVVPRYPAHITATDGIAAIRDGVDVLIKSDYGNLVQVPSVTNPDRTFFLAWDQDIDNYQAVSFTNIIENIQDAIIGPPLAAIDAVNPGADQVVYFTDIGEAASYTVSEYFRSISNATDAAALADEIGALSLATPIYVPPNLTTAIPVAPPVIKANGYRWSIFAFNGGETERAKATATADYQAVTSTALAAGERVHFPRWEYPVRSLGSGNVGVYNAGNVAVDVDCALEAKFIAGDVFWGLSGNMFQFTGPSAPLTVDQSDLTRMRWVGGVISAEDLTAEFGVGAGAGAAMMNIVHMYEPEVRGVRFRNGALAPSASNDLGCGAMDTAVGWNQNAGGILTRCQMENMYDLAVYLVSGFRDIVTLGTDPIATTSGSSTVTVTEAAHGYSVGDRIGLSGVVAFNGITLAAKEYAILSVTTNTYTVTAAGTATATGSGGGSAVISNNAMAANSLSTSIMDGGEFSHNWFARCEAGISSKRNYQGAQILYNRIRECTTGIAAQTVTDFAASGGKRTAVHGNWLYKIGQRPIWIRSGGSYKGTVVSYNHVENWGRKIFDGTDKALGVSLGGIHLDSMNSAVVSDNQLAMTDTYAGASWATGFEPTALMLKQDAGYIDGCVDCLIKDNVSNDVPRGVYDQSTSLRTRFRGNRLQKTSVANTLDSSSFIWETRKSYVSNDIALDSVGLKTIQITHGLGFNPGNGACIAQLGVTTVNDAQVVSVRSVSTDATYVTVAARVTVASATTGATGRINLQICID